MASAISYEYLQAKQGVANGLATLDSNGKLPVSQLPPQAVETYKGEFATEQALTSAYPTGKLADYAYVAGTLSYWYWNKSLTTPAWVNQQVTETVYTALSAAEKAAVPYIITP